MSAHVIGYFLDILSLLNFVHYFLYVLNKITIFRTLSAVGHLGLFRASLSVRLFFFLSHILEIFDDSFLDILHFIIINNDFFYPFRIVLNKL